MALTRTQKEEAIARLRDAFTSAQSVVFANFHGLGVSDTSEMRQELRNEGVQYKVVKKTLLRRALDESNLDGEAPALDGEVAVAYGDDPVVPASTIAKFVKKHKDSLSILGGVFGGVFKNKQEMEEIAAIPPMPVLRGMFVNVMNSPIQGLAVALSEIARSKE